MKKSEIHPSLMEGIYIECLKKGYEAREIGISFNDMISHLVKFGYKEANTYEFKSHFYVWFFDHFFQHAIYYDRMIQREPPMWPWAYQETTKDGKPNPQLDVPSIMMFSARQYYLDYLAMKVSNNKADDANRLAWIAIRMAIGIGTVQIILTLIQIYSDRLAKQGTNTEQQEIHSQLPTSHKKFSVLDQDASNCICPEDTFSQIGVK